MIYSPREDSFLLEKEVKKYSKDKQVLDMGTGSGILALASKKAGAKSVLAVDINSESIKLLKEKGISAIKSNLFSKVNGKFDLIIFNPPYLPEDAREGKELNLINSGGKEGDELILKFLNQSINHLTKNGIILLLVSSLTPQNRINTLFSKLNIEKTILSTQKFFFEELQVWKITSKSKLNKSKNNLLKPFNFGENTEKLSKNIKAILYE
ncbi:MAG: HemK2/MTQ2 family protein methyltransferase [Nanoarchaeota archaeon]